LRAAMREAGVAVIELRKTSYPVHITIADFLAIRENSIKARFLRQSLETGAKNLCLAGGVALNCVANGKILKDGHFERIWIQPACGAVGRCFSRLPFVQTTTSLAIRMGRSNERILSWALLLTAGDRTALDLVRGEVHDFE